MKLSPRDTAAFLRRPDPAFAVVLIHGADPMRVAECRRDLVLALIGHQGEDEMRLARLTGADLRKDGAALDDAMRAQGFFPGPRAVLVQEAADGIAPILLAAADAWSTGDATIVATAGQLPARSALRKGIEAHRRAVSIAIYDDPPSAAEVAQRLSEAGLAAAGEEAQAALMVLSRSLEPGDFRQTLEKLSLYKYGDESPLSPEDIEACAPRSSEAETDSLITVVAEGRPNDIAPVLRRLYAQGVTPVALCIQTLRHFRALHVVASDPGGPASGIGKLRPPAFGPRRDALQRQAGHWGPDLLEQALSVLIDTDLDLRSVSKTPERALVERALIRLAMISHKRGGRQPH